MIGTVFLLADNMIVRLTEGYSIRYFFKWNYQVYRSVVDWCSRHGFSLVDCALDFLSSILVAYLFVLLLRKVIVPIVRKFHVRAANGIFVISMSLGWLVFLMGFSNSVKYVPFSPYTHWVFDKIFYICFILTFLSILAQMIRAAIAWMIDRFRRRHPENYNTNRLLMDFSINILRMMAWLFVLLFVLQEVFHLKVTHLLASAGIVGFALAIAAKDTIANIFGAFSILGGRMFAMGDWIKAGVAEGVVERIGFRSVCIRSFDNGRLIEIPNHVIADSQIENYSRHQFWREFFTFGMVYQTTPEQMQQAMLILDQIAQDLSDVLAQGRKPQFDFIRFDNSALTIEGYVWFKASSWFAVRHARSQFNMEVLKRFRDAGLEMAYPTSTVYVNSTEDK